MKNTEDFPKKSHSQNFITTKLALLKMKPHTLNFSHKRENSIILPKATEEQIHKASQKTNHPKLIVESFTTNTAGHILRVNFAMHFQ